ncbi:MAG: hypothetical protein GY810_21175 [Aureispira sp.]|nr:hypothetical protein [Aureispira sp.]
MMRLIIGIVLCYWVLALVACTKNLKFDYNVDLLKSSQFLYVVEGDAKDNSGIINENGEWVVPLQDIYDLMILGENDQSYILASKEDRHSVYSKTTGMLLNENLPLDRYVSRQNLFERKDSLYILVQAKTTEEGAEKETILYSGDGSIINRFEGNRSYEPMCFNKDYYLLKGPKDSNVEVYNTAHELMYKFNLADFLRWNMHKTHSELVEVGRYIDSVHIINLKNAKSLKTEVPEDFYMFSYDDIILSYWNAGVDSFPIYVGADEEDKKAVEDYYKTKDTKRLHNLKLFQFYTTDLESSSKTKYSWNEIKGGYNIGGRIVHDSDKGVYTLWQNGKLRTDLPTFLYLRKEEGMHKDFDWMTGYTDDGKTIVFYKGQNFEPIKAKRIQFLTAYYFVVEYDDGQELRDSTNTVVVPKANQVFNDSYSDRDYPHTISLIRNDSLIVLDLKNDKVLVAQNEYVQNRVVRISETLCVISERGFKNQRLYNTDQKTFLKNAQKLAPYLVEGPIERISNNLGMYTVEGYLLDKNVLKYEDVGTYFKMNGELAFDWEENYPTLQGGIADNALIAKDFEIRDKAVGTGTTYQKFLFNQDGTQVWPKAALMGATKFDFIKNKDDLNAKLNQAKWNRKSIAKDEVIADVFGENVLTLLGIQLERHDYLGFEIIYATNVLDRVSGDPQIIAPNRLELGEYWEDEYTELLDSLKRGDFLILQEMALFRYGTEKVELPPLVLEIKAKENE